MFKVTSISVVLLLSLNLCSQNQYIKLPFTKKDNPTIVNSENIITELKINNYKDYYNEVSILKVKPNKKQHDFYNLTEHGILFVESKKQLKARSQAELNSFFNLDKKNDIYIDGYLLEHKKYKVDIDCIKEIEIIEPDLENRLKTKVLNIWTLPKEESQTRID